MKSSPRAVAIRPSMSSRLLPAALLLCAACSGAAAPSRSGTNWAAIRHGAGPAGGGTVTLGHTATGDTRGASDDFEPSCGAPAQGGDQRWTFTPEETNTYRIHVAAQYDSVLAVRGADGREIGCNDDSASKRESELVTGLQAGQTVQLFVDGYGDAEGSYELTVEILDVPPDREGRLTLAEPVDATTAGSTDHHTPGCGSRAGSPDHVWHFTAPRAARYRFHVSAQYDSVLAVVDESGAEIGCNDDQNGTSESEVRVALQAGQSYGIVVDGYQGATGAYELQASEEGAVVQAGTGPTGGPLTVGQAVSGNTTGSPDRFTPSCGSRAGSGDHVWELTPTQGAEYRARVDARFDSVIAVFNQAGAEMACNDDAGSTQESELSIVLQPGQTYRVVVDGYSGGEGEYRLLVDNPVHPPTPPAPVPVPANPPIRAALSLNHPITGDTSVSADQYTPGCGSTAGSFDAVYEFTPRRSSRYRFDVTAQFDSVLAVFDDSGVEVGCNDDHGNTSASEVVVRLSRRRTYYVVVDGYQGRTGPYVLIAHRQRKPGRRGR